MTTRGDGQEAETQAVSEVQHLIDTLYSHGTPIGKTGKTFDSFDALSTRANLKTIEHLMKLSAAKYTLEVGLAFGASAVVFAAMHREQDPDGRHVHIAIDPYQSTVWDGAGTLKLEEARLAETVQVFEEMSSVVLPRLMAEGRRFGMIYVDGSHLFEDVFIDAYYSARLLESGGYLLFDDCADRHVAKVLAFIDSSVPGLKRQKDLTWKQAIARLLGRRQLTIYRRVGAIERQGDAPFANF